MREDTSTTMTRNQDEGFGFFKLGPGLPAAGSAAEPSPVASTCHTCQSSGRTSSLRKPLPSTLRLSSEPNSATASMLSRPCLLQ